MFLSGVLAIQLQILMRLPHLYLTFITQMAIITNNANVCLIW